MSVNGDMKKKLKYLKHSMEDSRIKTIIGEDFNARTGQLEDSRIWKRQRG